MVYWKPDGGAVVYRAFVREPGMTAMIEAGDRSGLATLAEAAVAAATGGGGIGSSGGGAGGEGGGPVAAPVAMEYVSSIAASVDLTDDDISLEIITASVSGDRGNSSTFDTDVFTRN